MLADLRPEHLHQQVGGAVDHPGRIAEALGRISDVQFEIYSAQPGLLPKQLVATKFGARVLSNRPIWTPPARLLRNNGRGAQLRLQPYLRPLSREPAGSGP